MHGQAESNMPLQLFQSWGIIICLTGPIIISHSELKYNIGQIQIANCFISNLLFFYIFFFWGGGVGAGAGMESAFYKINVKLLITGIR